MTDKKLELSRRKILAGAGAIGLAGAGAGLGTSAYFSDQETFTNNSLEAGELDLFVDYFTSKDQSGVDTGSTTGSGTIDGEGSAVGQYVIKDVKPGDSGFLAFCPKIVDNPGWLWIGSQDGLVGSENGTTEPEREDPDEESGRVELLDEVQVSVEYCEVNTSKSDVSSFDDVDNKDDFTTINELKNPAEYTLRDLFKELESGFLLDGDATTSGTDAYPASPDSDMQNGPCICIEWSLPVNHANEIQTDSAEFDITFGTYQERHNPTPPNPFADVTVAPGDDLATVVANAGSGETISVFGGDFGDGSAYDSKLTVDTDRLTLARSSAERPLIAEQVVVSGDGVTLCGFEVSPPDATSNGEGEAIRISNSPDDVVIANNKVSEFSADQSSLPAWEGIDGIVAFGGDSDPADPIENITISNNIVEKIEGLDEKGGAAGISIQGAVDGATVRNNVVSEIGQESTGWGFGIVIRGTGNNSEVPTNVDVINNDISDVLANTATSTLGVGFGVEADGTNYSFSQNTIDNVNIGVEIKAGATELALIDNSLSSINDSVNSKELYLGDQTDNAEIASIIDDNTFDQPVKAGSAGSYQQTIVPDS